VHRRTLALCLTLGAALAGAAPAHAAPVELEVLSSRADLTSGGDALVRVRLEPPADASRLQVRLGDRDVTGLFARRPNGHVEGLLTGIPNGVSTLTATAGAHGARLEVKGHPNEGPMISGPLLQPWFCQEGAKDANCNQPATYELQARTQNGFVAYDPANPPQGIRQTTTTEGRTVPFIIRIETGYQLRDQYKIATLFDPSKPWEPWAPQEAWNRRMVMTHGGSCGTDRRAGTAPGVVNEELLGKGFLVASTALNNLGHNCNPVVIAESELMVRERISEQYGPPKATLGTGCSGGAIAQLMVAHAYPGFYDGITVACTFADLFTTGKHAIVGHQLRNRINVAGVQGTEVYTPADQAAIGGSPLATADDYLFDTAFWPAINGSGGCGGMPASVARWSSANPTGVRCGVLDHNVNVLGRGPTGYVGIPFDNVGLQYGLKALLEGRLTPSKFVDFNARVGGFDKTTLQLVPQRTEGDLQQIVNAYRAGYLAIGNTLGETPILEGRGSNEVTAHVTYPTKVLRERLERFYGDAGNHVLWQGPVPLLGNTSFANRMVLAMDRWVQRIQADGSDRPKAQKVRANKPADLVDMCEYADGASRPGGPDDCPELVRFYDAPTQVAGESGRLDVLKCQLKPLRREDYGAIGQLFTADQWATLQRTFPGGVCDFSKPGVGETPTVPWLTFAGGPGGEPLGDPPRSAPFTIEGGGAVAGAAASSGSSKAAGRVRATLKRRVLEGGRLRVACRLSGASLRSCRVVVAERRGRRTRTLRTVTLKPGKAAVVRTGKAKRLALRATLTAADGRRFVVRRSLVRR
jgi:hypothetical protein